MQNMEGFTQKCVCNKILIIHSKLLIIIFTNSTNVSGFHVVLDITCKHSRTQEYPYNNDFNMYS